MYLAKLAYHAYGKAVSFKNFRGDPMPEFEDLPPKIRRAWSAAAGASVEAGQKAMAEALAAVIEEAPQAPRVVITTRYGTDDPDQSCDYHEVLVEVDGRELQTFGDWYHDRGQEKAHGFELAVRQFFPDAVVERVDVSDYPV